jgi:hypothetical protein
MKWLRPTLRRSALSLGVQRVMLTCSQAVDKLARTARRAMDTHMKQAMSKPRTATALRRITAMVQDVQLCELNHTFDHVCR